MIMMSDVMPISFLKLEKYTGSDRGMRYRMELMKKDDDGKALLVTAWPEPYAFDYTDEEKKIRAEFSFDEEGIEAGIAWLNEQHDTVCGTAGGR